MKRRRHSLALVAFVLVGAATCLLLGWWQWTRFESSSGTAQNLGYALQWPLFAVAFFWGYRRFLQLEDESELADRLAAEQADGPETDVAKPSTNMPITGLPEGFLPSRPQQTPSTIDDDPVHAEYNRLLAQLAAQDEAPSNAAKETK